MMTVNHPLYDLIVLYACFFRKMLVDPQEVQRKR